MKAHHPHIAPSCPQKNNIQGALAAPLSIIVKAPKVGKALMMDVLKDWIFNTTLDEARK